MKSTLRLKFIILYIIFGFLSLFTVSLLATQLLLNMLEKDSSQNMYRVASQTANSYLPSYFSEDVSSGRYTPSCRQCSYIWMLRSGL